MEDPLTLSHDLLKKLTQSQDKLEIDAFIANIEENFEDMEIDDPSLFEDLVMFLLSLIRKTNLQKDSKVKVMDILLEFQVCYTNFNKIFLSCDGMKLCLEYLNSDDVDKYSDALEVISQMAMMPDFKPIILNTPGILERIVYLSGFTNLYLVQNMLLEYVIIYLTTSGAIYNTKCIEIGFNLLERHYYQIPKKRNQFIKVVFLMLNHFDRDTLVNAIIYRNKLKIVFGLFNRYNQIVDSLILQFLQKLIPNKQFCQYLIEANILKVAYPLFLSRHVETNKLLVQLIQDIVTVAPYFIQHLVANTLIMNKIFNNLTSRIQTQRQSNLSINQLLSYELLFTIIQNTNDNSIALIYESQILEKVVNGLYTQSNRVIKGVLSCLRFIENNCKNKNINNGIWRVVNQKLMTKTQWKKIMREQKKKLSLVVQSYELDWTDFI